MAALGPTWTDSRIAFERIPPDVRLTPSVLSGVSRPAASDPEHRLAYDDVATGEADWAEVRDVRTRTVLYRAWRVSRTSFAWQTSSMSAPAFMPYR
jgi:hypothetical protein